MMNLAKIQVRMRSLKEWSLEEEMIVNEIEFNNFKEAICFVNDVAEIAEKYNHHPDILIKYNVVKVTLTTHSEKCLTEKDFDVAEEIDKL